MNAMLSPEEAELFYHLYHSLMFDVNRRLQVVPNVENYDDFSFLPPETRLMDVRHAPRVVQEIAFQKGLVPYVPADHD